MIKPYFTHTRLVDKQQEDLGLKTPEERESPVLIDLNEIAAIEQTHYLGTREECASILMKSGAEVIVSEKFGTMYKLINQSEDK